MNSERERERERERESSSVVGNMLRLHVSHVCLLWHFMCVVCIAFCLISPVVCGVVFRRMCVYIYIYVCVALLYKKYTHILSVSLSVFFYLEHYYLSQHIPNRTRPIYLFNGTGITPPLQLYIHLISLIITHTHTSTLY